MDGVDIAYALLAGREFPIAKLKQISTFGDGADQLYVWLFEVVRSPGSNQDVEKSIREICAHQPTAEAWVQIVRYARQPTGRSYTKLAKAARMLDNSGGTVTRLAPLVLVRNHRRQFAGLVSKLTDLEDVFAELKHTPGPARLYAKRRKRSITGSFPPKIGRLAIPPKAVVYG